MKKRNILGGERLSQAMFHSLHPYNIQIGSYCYNFKDGEIKANKHLVCFKIFIQAETSEGFETFFLAPFKECL